MKKKGSVENALKGWTDPMIAKEDLKMFKSPAGQVFLYWMYHGLSLQMVAKTHGHSTKPEDGRNQIGKKRKTYIQIFSCSSESMPIQKMKSK